MTFEEETEYSTGHYHCIDPIENFKIRIILQPVKHFHIPLPQFDAEQTSSDISGSQEESQSDVEEYVFKWQEKILSNYEIKKFSDEHDWKKKLTEKYHDGIKIGLNDSNKVFSYVEVDKYSLSESKLNPFTEKQSFVSNSLSKDMSSLSVKHYKNIPKRKIINYYPSEEFKNQAHSLSKNAQKMFLMIDLGQKLVDTDKSEEDIREEVLCCIVYDHSKNVLQVTPSFSKSKSRPYVVGKRSGNDRNVYYYWIYHESFDIKEEHLTKEIQFINKVIDYQEVKKFQVDTEFFIGNPDHFYVNVFGEILSAQDFEYDSLHVHYFIKLPSGWGYTDINSLMGRTQTCHKNSEGLHHFSHLFEMNFCLDLSLHKDALSTPTELFFEVLSVDKYKRYRNEGYTYVTLPVTPGIYNFSLRCWRISDQRITSQLQRFFIGGGPDLEDVSYVGLSNNENSEVMSRFGLETIPSGLLNVKLNILQQSLSSGGKAEEHIESEKSMSSKLDSGSLLSSVNAVLEAFRKARERMLKAKKELEHNCSCKSSENKTNC